MVRAMADSKDAPVPGKPSDGPGPASGASRGPAGVGPQQRRHLTGAVAIVVLVVVVLGALLIRSSLVVGDDDYDRAETALANLDAHQERLATEMNDRVAAAMHGQEPAKNVLTTKELYADLDAASDSRAGRDDEFAGRLAIARSALDEYAKTVEQQQAMLAPLARLIKTCDDHLMAYPTVTEEGITEASLSAEIADCEEATSITSPAAGLSELQQVHVNWIKQRKQAVADFQEAKNFERPARQKSIERSWDRNTTERFKSERSRLSEVPAHLMGQRSDALSERITRARQGAREAKNGN